jgi:non-ribosomal peptide synthetase component F
MVGPFMNTLPLRIDLSGEPSLPALAGRVKDVVLEAMAHQDAPFHDVRDALVADHGPSAASIGEVALIMEDEAPERIVFGGLTLTRAAPADIVARREVTLAIATANGEVAGTMIYDRDLFEVDSIQAIVRDFQAALAPAGAVLAQG